MTFSGGGTPRQLAARAAFRTPNPLLERLANVSLLGEGKLRPDSTFSQADLDKVNERQDRYRSIYGSRYGQDKLKDIQRFDRVEDIPVYTEEEIRQQNIDRLKANPKSFYNKKRPKEVFGQGPKNQKVPQAVVDAYNNLTAKFAQLRDTGNQNAVGRADFENVFNALRNSPAEFIKPGEVYEGPDFRDPQGKLLRERPDSIFNRERIAQAQAESQAAPSTRSTTSTPTSQPFSETRETGRAREAGRPVPKKNAVDRKARRAAMWARQFKRMRNR